MANATGGTITYSGGKTIHTFTSSGTFTTPQFSIQPIIETLVVGGGGSGGRNNGGGGGGGGISHDTGFTVTSETAYTITVGNGGGTTTTSIPGASGGNSSINSVYIGYGGGGGGSGLNQNGVNGGSGGGGGAANRAGGTGTDGSGGTLYGNNGGRSSTSEWYAGGGGGAGAVGQTATVGNSGDGGNGYAFSTSGSSIIYGGGGGGGSYAGANSAGGTGGGGAGKASNSGVAGTAGTVNLGGGGGGGSGGNGNGGAGGKGIVIISYETDGFIQIVATTNYLLNYRKTREPKVKTTLTNVQTELYNTSLLSDANLVAYYQFEGNANDYKATYNGTATSVTYGTSYGLFNQGANFAGAGYININAGFGNTFSFTFRFKTTATSLKPLFYAGNQPAPTTPTGWIPMIIMNANGTVRAETWVGAGSSVTSSSAYNDGNWHTLVFVSGASYYSLYIDGSLIGTYTATVNNSWWTKTVIGAGYVDTGRGSASTAYYYFVGQIDDVAIFNKALNTTEIALLYYQRYPAINITGVE